MSLVTVDLVGGRHSTTPPPSYKELGPAAKIGVLPQTLFKN